jgi:hypothetical protein
MTSTPSLRRCCSGSSIRPKESAINLHNSGGGEGDEEEEQQQQQQQQKKTTATSINENAAATTDGMQQLSHLSLKCRH